MKKYRKVHNKAVARYKKKKQDRGECLHCNKDRVPESKRFCKAHMLRDREVRRVWWLKKSGKM